MNPRDFSMLVLRARKEKGWSQSDLSATTKLSNRTIVRVESFGVGNLTTLRALVDALGMTVRESDLQQIVREARKTTGPRGRKRKGATIGVVDAMIDASEIEPGPVPDWDAEIAAGQWMDAATAQLDYDTQGEIINRGLFTVRIRGDSMIPHYPSGAKVTFQLIRPDVGGPVVGRDYYWQTNEGQCTLKRCHSISEDEYVLAPLNRKYKKMHLAKQSLSRLAIVRGIFSPPPFE